MAEVIALRGGDALVADGESVPDVVRLAHGLLEMALAGRLRALAVACVESGGHVGCEWTCTAPDMHLMTAAVGDLHFSVFESRRLRSDEVG